MEDKPISLRLPGLREPLGRLAKQDGRTLSGYIRKVLEEHLAAATVQGDR